MQKPLEKFAKGELKSESAFHPLKEKCGFDNYILANNFIDFISMN